MSNPAVASTMDPVVAASPSHNQNSTPANTEEEEKELAFGQMWKDAGQKPPGPQRPSLAQHASDGGGGRRKSSVQFSTAAAEETIRRESVATGARPSTASQIRNPSPPPAVPYHRGISFDTFATPDASAEAFSIQYKHQDFQYTSRTRTFICGTDAKDYSEYALEWTMDELVDDGDEIVCLRVVAEDSYEKRNYRQEADRLLDSVIQKNAIERKAISIKMELAVGKVTDVIQSMIQLYEPVAIIVGTRGRKLTGVEGLMPGSVSKYCLQRSPVPTIVVRPSSKRTKKKMKRQQEAGRSVYTNILSKAHTVGGKTVIDKSGVNDTFETRASDQEATEVEKAIGSPRRGILRNKNWGGPLARVTSATSEEDEAEFAPRFALPLGYLSTETAPRADLAMNNPIIQGLVEDWDDDSPSGSRARSPAAKEKKSGSAAKEKKSDPDAAVSDTSEDDGLRPTIVDERRPSTRSQTPWLAAILAKPEAKPHRRSISQDRRGDRSRSR